MSRRTQDILTIVLAVASTTQSVIILLAVVFIVTLNEKPVGTANTEVVHVLPPCEYEDSANCFWDAGTSGNGLGTSFVDIDGTAYYPEGE